MTLPAALRRLDVELPACPRTLVQMLALMREPDASLQAMAELIESDLALAAALVRTVNSAMYGLLRRIETVGEALRYLGTDQVAAITYEVALRAAFPPTPAMEALWRRAGQGGLLMGRSARALQLDPLQAHTAGLFALSGRAVLLAHAGERYAALLEGLGHDREALRAAEQEAFGITQGGYGSALCAAWGLAEDVVRYVREHGQPAAGWSRHAAPLRRLLALGTVVDALLDEDDAGLSAEAVAAPGGLGEQVLLQAVAPNWDRLQAALG